MRLIILHNEYQQKGGEDAVVLAEAENLKRHGHEVRVLRVSNDSIRGRWGALKAGWNAQYSASSREWLRSEIQAHRPELVHVHNFFPLLTPSVYDACAEEKVAVVQTLHNYRVLCANGMLLRQGRPCEDCVQGSPYQAVLHGCYRGSRAASIPVARMIARHRAEQTWSRKPQRLIALTEFARSRFVAAGIAPGQVEVKPNFISENEALAPRSRAPLDRPLDRPLARKVLFVGRLSEEKGVQVLLQAWKMIQDAHLDVELEIVGDGPERDALAAQASMLERVRFRGQVGRTEISKLMGEAQLLVVPSLWYEGFPMVLVEAFAHSLPALVSGLGSLAELVRPSVNGLHFHAGDAEDLASKLTGALGDPDGLARLGLGARSEFDTRYTAARNHELLMGIYERALSAGRAR